MRLFAATFAIWLAGSAITSAANPAPARPDGLPPMQDGNRYLFLIDVSSSMALCSETTEKTVRDLVRSGMNGEMNPGDAFAIWPYREKVFADAFAPETWLPQLNDKLADTAGRFVKSMKYEGTSFFYTALVEAFKVIRASRSVTVILINDGTETLQGTPFDLYANTIYRDHAAKMRKEKRPFVTTLVAVDGKVIGCTVGSGGDAITLPSVPADVKAKLAAEFAAVRAAAKPILLSATNAPPPIATAPQPTAKKPAAKPKASAAPAPVTEPLPKTVATVTTPPAPPPSPTPTTAPVVATVPPSPTVPPVSKPPPAPEPVVKPTKRVVSEAIVSTPKPAEKTPAPPTVAVPSTAPPTPSVVATKPQLETNPNPPKPLPAETIVPPAKMPPPPAVSAAPVPSEKPIAAPMAPKVESTVPTVPPPPSPAAKSASPDTAKQLGVVPSATGLSRNHFLVIGVALLLVAGLICWFIFRSSRGPKRPSLISRTMGR